MGKSIKFHNTSNSNLICKNVNNAGLLCNNESTYKCIKIESYIDWFWKRKGLNKLGHRQRWILHHTKSPNLSLKIGIFEKSNGCYLAVHLFFGGLLVYVSMED